MLVFSLPSLFSFLSFVYLSSPLSCSYSKTSGERDREVPLSSHSMFPFYLCLRLSLCTYYLDESISVWPYPAHLGLFIASTMEREVKRNSSPLCLPADGWTARSSLEQLSRCQFASNKRPFQDPRHFSLVVFLPPLFAAPSFSLFCLSYSSLAPCSSLSAVF